MERAIKIYDEDYELLKKIKGKEGWTYILTLSKAIKFFAKAKRMR